MSQGQGHQLAVALDDETTYGSDPGAPSAVKVYLEEIGIKASQDYDVTAGVGSRTADEALPNVIDVAGPLSPKLAPENVGKLLKHALGVVNTTGVGPYMHTITIGDLPVGLVIDKDMGARLAAADRYEKFNGNRVAGFSVEFGGDKQPMMSFDIKGASHSFPAAPLDATPDDNGCTKFSLFNATVQEGGADAGTVTSGSFKFSNGLDDKGGYGVNDSGVRSSLDEGVVEVTGNIAARFDTLTLLNKAINNTESSLKLILSQGDGLGSSGNGYLEISLAAVKFKQTSPEVSGPHGVMVNLEFVGYGANACTAVLKNALTTI